MTLARGAYTPLRADMHSDYDVEKEAPHAFADESTESLPTYAPHPLTLAVPDFVPSWEGLRGVAVLMTCYCHVVDVDRPASDVLGRGGVAVFFVLSGFLITGVLVKQQTAKQALGERFHYRHLPSFYMDRNARLYPALLAMVAVTGLLWLQKEAWRVPVDFVKEAARTLLYVEDIDFGEKLSNYWGNTWSLAIEEQFYVVWSLALPLLLTLRPALRRTILCGLIAVSFTLYYLGAVDCAYVAYNLQGAYSPTANVWKMYVGALLRLSPDVPRWLMHRRTGYVGLGCLALLTVWSHFDAPLDVAMLFGSGERAQLYAGWRVMHEPLSTASAVLLVLGSMHGNAVLESDLLRFVGRVSYSLYLYQWPLLLIVDWPHGYVGCAVTAMAFVFASLSTIYLEEPIRTRYRKWRHGSRSH